MFKESKPLKKAVSAFTLVEMMVVIFLLGVMATTIVPRLLRRSPSVEWPNVLDDVNNLVFFARQEAIANHKLYRLTFKKSSKKSDCIMVEEEQEDPEKPQRKIFKQASSYIFNTKYTLPEETKISAVYHGREEMTAENKGQGFCHVIPDGLVQDILIHFTRATNEPQPYATFKMMPFFGKFEYLDGHVKPERR